MGGGGGGSGPSGDYKHMELSVFSRNTCSKLLGLPTPHIKEPCLFVLNLGAASDCLHRETLEMLSSDCQGYMSLLLL